MSANGLKNKFFDGFKFYITLVDRVVHRVGSDLMGRLLKLSREEIGAGFTLVELLVVIAILGTVSGIAIPAYSQYIEKARITKAIAEIRLLQKEIKLYQIDRDALPNSLEDLERGNLLDPYGNKYVYFNPDTAPGQGVGQQRRDKWDKPLNDDYDLYSMGRDGDSARHLHNKKSHDDIIRAREGRFIGLASEF